MSKYEEYIKTQMEKRPQEATLIRKVVRAMKKAGEPVVTFWDGEESFPVSGEKQIVETAFNYDQFYLLSRNRSWVRIIMGENPEDMIVDHTTDLEDAFAPIFDRF